jgi:hypothetical protein
MVTSPPYNVGKDYDEDLGLEEYRRLLQSRAHLGRHEPRRQVMH